MLVAMCAVLVSCYCYDEGCVCFLCVWCVCVCMCVRVCSWFAPRMYVCMRVLSLRCMCCVIVFLLLVVCWLCDVLCVFVVVLLFEFGCVVDMFFVVVGAGVGACVRVWYFLWLG